MLNRRIQIREQELFSEANRINPDYFGVTSTGVLVSAMTGFHPLPLIIIAGVVPFVRIVDNLVG